MNCGHVETPQHALYGRKESPVRAEEMYCVDARYFLCGHRKIGVRGGARTGYLIPGCDGNGAWTRPENSSAVVVVAAAVVL